MTRSTATPVLAPNVTITEGSYAFIADTVYSHSRIRLGKDKQALVISRLTKRLRKLGLGSFEEYCHLLKSPDGPAELAQLIDLISTNHTHFFRESDHFDFLEKTIVPEWTATLSRTRQPFRIWSAACSSGEEPYSIAILLSEILQGRSELDWRIDASDISTRILDHASAGVYETERIKLPNPLWLSKYFQRGVGQYEGFARIKQELQRRITFRHINLFQPEYPVERGPQVIFCRNVMIYFDQPTIQTLITRFTQFLPVGGYLIVGHSESLLGISHSLTQVKPSVYRRN